MGNDGWGVMGPGLVVWHYVKGNVFSFFPPQSPSPPPLSLLLLPHKGSLGRDEAWTRLIPLTGTNGQGWRGKLQRAGRERNRRV